MELNINTANDNAVCVNFVPYVYHIAFSVIPVYQTIIPVF
jgi:hypothetical protein